MLPKSPLRSPERRNRAAFDGRSSRERGIERGRSAKTVASRRRIAYPVRAMKAKMVILTYCSFHLLEVNGASIFVLPVHPPLRPRRSSRFAGLTTVGPRHRGHLTKRKKSYAKAE